MTRKHFEIIARELKEARAYLGESKDFQDTLRAVMIALEEINPRFDSERFLKAVGHNWLDYSKEIKTVNVPVGF